MFQNTYRVAPLHLAPLNITKQHRGTAKLAHCPRISAPPRSARCSLRSPLSRLDEVWFAREEPSSSVVFHVKPDKMPER